LKLRLEMLLELELEPKWLEPKWLEPKFVPKSLKCYLKLRLVLEA
jgi:hypothetical protein